MENIKKFKKLFVILIFVLAIIIGTKVQAFTTIHEPKLPMQADPNNPDIWYYCIIHGQPYRADITQAEFELSKSEPFCTNDKCAYGHDPGRPWTDKKTYMEYTKVGPVNDRAHQDAAYVIATAREEGVTGENFDIQHSLWGTSINKGNKDGTGKWGKEAVAYKDFYDTIHNGEKDIYESKINDKTDTTKITTQVDQTGKQYIVGPFIIEYPNGNYKDDEKQRKLTWSYITKIELLDQDNNTVGTVEENVVNDKIEIVGASGDKLSDKIKGNNFPNPNDEFYVKFSSTLGNINNIKLKVHFKYLESCSATLVEYKATIWHKIWEKVATGSSCPNRTCDA